MLMLTNKIPLRFSKSTDIDMLTGTPVAFYLEDTMGDLPDIRFTDVEDFREYWIAIEKEFYEVYSEIRQLKIENRELKEQLQKYTAPNCRKCIHYACDSASASCMNPDSVIGEWNPFPYEWDYEQGARDCKEYEE